MDRMTLQDLKNILNMQMLLIDVPTVKLVTRQQAQKLVIANRFRIKKIIEKKEGNTFTHFHTPVSEYRDVSINLHNIWRFLPSTSEKRMIAMKLCCINYDKIFTRHEKNLIEGMETISNQTGIIKKSREEIEKLRNNLILF